MKFSVVIPTYNRADELRDTLTSMSRLASTDQWELLVVDNNSSDATRDVVREAARNFPVDLHYVFEPEQGRSAALNAGIGRSRGDIVVTTDDDVRVDPDWLERAGEALETLRCDYVGGKSASFVGRSAPSVDTGSRRQAVGRDCAPRLRSRSDPVFHPGPPRAAWRQHGIPS